MTSSGNEDTKRWPSPGDSLVHKFRRHLGEAVAEVVSVDVEKGKITVRYEGKLYSSLSAAAKSASGFEYNGWIYWGLKPQTVYPKLKTAFPRD